MTHVIDVLDASLTAAHEHLQELMVRVHGMEFTLTALAFCLAQQRELNRETLAADFRNIQQFFPVSDDPRHRPAGETFLAALEVGAQVQQSGASDVEAQVRALLATLYAR